MKKEKNQFVIITGTKCKGNNRVNEYLIQLKINEKDLQRIFWDEDIDAYIEFCKNNTLPDFGKPGPYLFRKERASLVLIGRGAKDICAKEITKYKKTSSSKPPV